MTAHLHNLVFGAIMTKTIKTPYVMYCLLRIHGAKSCATDSERAPIILTILITSLPAKHHIRR